MFNPFIYYWLQFAFICLFFFRVFTFVFLRGIHLSSLYLEYPCQGQLSKLCWPLPPQNGLESVISLLFLSKFDWCYCLFRSLENFTSGHVVLKFVEHFWERWNIINTYERSQILDFFLYQFWKDRYMCYFKDCPFHLHFQMFWPAAVQNIPFYHWFSYTHLLAGTDNRNPSPTSPWSLFSVPPLRLVPAALEFAGTVRMKELL